MKKIGVVILGFILMGTFVSQAHALNEFWFDSSNESSYDGKSFNSVGLERSDYSWYPHGSPDLRVIYYDSFIEEDGTEFPPIIYSELDFLFNFPVNFDFPEPPYPYEHPWMYVPGVSITPGRYGLENFSFDWSLDPGSHPSTNASGYMDIYGGTSIVGGDTSVHYEWVDLSFDFVIFEEGDPNRRIIGGLNTPARAIPEPSTILLFSTGILGAFIRSRRV